MKQSEITGRRRLIAEYIESHGSLTTTDACKMFNVSDETIRKDFLYLEKLQVIEKIYGGARLHKADETKPYLARKDEHYFTKASIVRRAMEFIPQDVPSTIALDMGTTVSMLAMLLARREGNLIITNSASCIQHLTGSSNRLFVPGGEYNPVTHCFDGETAYAAIENFSIDVAFFGTGGVMNRNGISSPAFGEIRLKKEYIRHSKKKIVLTDSSKFQNTSLVEVAPWSEIDAVITDKDLPPEAVEQLSGLTELIMV